MTRRRTIDLAAFGGLVLVQIRAAIQIVTSPSLFIEQHARGVRVPHGTPQPTPAVSTNDRRIEVFPKGEKGLVESEEGKEVNSGRGVESGSDG